MSDAYIIEVSGRTAGIVARDNAGQRFRFFAATHFFNALEGSEFSGPREAEQAARRHLDKKRGGRGISMPPGESHVEPIREKIQ